MAQGIWFKNTSVTFTRPNMKTLWQPSNLLSSLVAWWKADTGVAFDGSNNVTSWADQSGNGLNLTSDATYKPTYTALAQNSLAGVNFTGNRQDCVVTNAALAPPKTSSWSVSFAFKWSGYGTPGNTSTWLNMIMGAYLGGSSGSWYAGVDSVSGCLSFGLIIPVVSPPTAAAIARGNTVLTAGKTYIVTINYSGTGTASGIQIYVNGVAETMTTLFDTFGANTLNTSLAFTLGTTNNAALGSTYSMFEAMFANRVLTASETMAVCQYLEQKWSIF